MQKFNNEVLLLNLLLQILVFCVQLVDQVFWVLNVLSERLDKWAYGEHTGLLVASGLCCALRNSPLVLIINDHMFMLVEFCARRPPCLI
jgi:hypothetical protein